MGMANFYRRYILLFAQRAAPLYQLLEKGVKFVWSQIQQKSFDDLKGCLKNDDVMLHLPDVNKPFILKTDASGFAMSAILVQNDDAGNDRVVWYASRALRTGERKWSATERECAAVIFGVDTFHQFLLGARFTLITDHQALVSLKKMSNTNAKLIRWVLKLQGYSFDIVHRPGRLHVDADYLSRPVEQQTPLLLESIKA